MFSGINPQVLGLLAFAAKGIQCLTNSLNLATLHTGCNPQGDYSTGEEVILRSSS